MMIKSKKQGPVRGCLVPVLVLAGCMALCYVFCFVLWTLNSAAIANTSGGFVGFPVN